MRCLQCNRACLKLALESLQNEAPFTQTSQAAVVSPLDLMCWAAEPV